MDCYEKKQKYKSLLTQFQYFGLISTCTTDEHCAAEGHTTSATGVDPHRQRFDQSSLLVGHIVRQPGSLGEEKKNQREIKTKKDIKG